MFAIELRQDCVFFAAFRPIARAQAQVALLRHSLLNRTAEPLEGEALAMTLVRRAVGERTARPPAPAPQGMAGLISWLATKLRSRRNRMALLELSDNQLKDVGISRSQIDSDHSRYRMSMSRRLERHRF